MDGTQLQLADGTIQLVEGELHVVHWNAGGGAQESGRVPGHERSHLVVGDSRQLTRLVGAGDGLDRWIRRIDDLDVAVTCAVHHAETGIQVEQSGEDPLHVRQPHPSGSERHAPLVVLGSDDVVEHVDLHVSLLTSGGLLN